MKDKMKKQIVKHLKEDKRTFKREAADDEELIKRLIPKKRVKTAAKHQRDGRKKK